MRAMRLCFPPSLSNWMVKRSFASSSTMRCRSASVGCPSTISNSSRRSLNSAWSLLAISVVRTVPLDGGGIHYRLSRHTAAGADIVAHSVLWFLTLIWSNYHGAHHTILCSLFEQWWYHCCGVRGVFLSRQPPAGAAVTDHTVMLSCWATAVAAVDVVKFFVI